MNFRRFYINGHADSISFEYRCKTYTLGLEVMWNNWMNRLTILTTPAKPKVEKEEKKPTPLTFPPPPKKFRYNTNHHLAHLSAQTDEQVRMTIKYYEWIIANVDFKEDKEWELAVYNMSLNTTKLRLEKLFAGDLYYWYLPSDELLELRKIVRTRKDFKTSDIIRNILDARLIFVFDTKDDNGEIFQEVYWLGDWCFEKMNPTKYKTRRVYVEYLITHDWESSKWHTLQS